jgi:hypothetical protein
MTDKSKKEKIIKQIKDGSYVDRDDVKNATRQVKMERNAQGGWST